MLMANAVEFLREHVPSTTRMHYIVTKGGAAPNIVPDDAELFLYARHPSMTVLSGIWERILKCAKGAAMATETTVEVRIVSSDANIVNNQPLSERVYRNYTEIGGLTYTPAEQAFAEKLFPLLPEGTTAKLGSERNVQPLDRERGEGGGASTDVGDVSWNVPTIGITAATWVPGTPAHSWYATAASGMDIGRDGMVLAAKVLAATAQDLFTEPALIEAAKADFTKRTGGVEYESKIPMNQKPPLDYRNVSR
jgi:aminobenzoyl-glutamate utilization protein B